MIRPDYAPWTSRQHDLAQRQSADPVAYAYAGYRQSKPPRSWKSKLLTWSAVALLIGTAVLLRS